MEALYLVCGARRPQLKRYLLGRAGGLLRTTVSLLALSLLSAALAAQQPDPQSYKPPRGFVPDSATAVRIAVAVWIPIYGESHIMAEQPFVATLKDGVWTVVGTLPRPYTQGGVAMARIAKRDGRILFVKHSQ